MERTMELRKCGCGMEYNTKEDQCPWCLYLSGMISMGAVHANKRGFKKDHRIESNKSCLVKEDEREGG